MCIHLVKLLSAMCLVVCSLSVQSAGLAGSGDTLAMLQKIQGPWRTTCKPMRGTKSSFSITKLSVSYTHFRFKITEYKSGRCIAVRSLREEKYGFALRGSQVSLGGKSVFAIDFKQGQVFGEKGGLYPLNIVRFEDGSLLFGDDFVGPRGERLMRLDKQVVFVR